jgi:hypothetical protein
VAPRALMVILVLIVSEWDGPAVLPPNQRACLLGGDSRRNRAMPRKSNAAVVSIGIDPGKNTLHLIGLDARGEIVLREKVARSKIVSRLANVPPCLIGIEVGTGTHYVTRELRALDHDVRQVPPVYAKPFRQTHKNDFRDAHAVAEAVQRPTTRCVPPKTDEQLDLQALHRVRYRKAVVGDIGIRSKLDYTAHGDAINSAARLEAMNKELGSSICIGPVAAGRCDPSTLRPLGTVALRGLVAPIAVFEPWPAEASADWRARYLTAMAAILSDPAGAAALFDDLAAEMPSDPVPLYMAQRTRSSMH